MSACVCEQEREEGREGERIESWRERERERGRERELGRERERERERDRESQRAEQWSARKYRGQEWWRVRHLQEEYVTVNI